MAPLLASSSLSSSLLPGVVRPNPDLLDLPNMDLKICHINAQSLRNERHFELFKEYFRCHHFDIITVSETWLNHLVSDNIVFLPSFSLYRHDRRVRSGGGVAIYPGMI